MIKAGFLGKDRLAVFPCPDASSVFIRHRVKAVIDTRGQRISCSHFVVEDSYIRDEQRQSTAYR